MNVAAPAGRPFVAGSLNVRAARPSSRRIRVSGLDPFSDARAPFLFDHRIGCDPLLHAGVHHLRREDRVGAEVDAAELLVDPVEERRRFERHQGSVDRQSGNETISIRLWRRRPPGVR